MNTLTVHFGVVTHDDPKGDGQMYWAEFKVTPEQALHMTSDAVVELIADQLKRKPGKRTWELPPGHEQPDEQKD